MTARSAKALDRLIQNAEQNSFLLEDLLIVKQEAHNYVNSMQDDIKNRDQTIAELRQKLAEAEAALRKMVAAWWKARHSSFVNQDAMVLALLDAAAALAAPEAEPVCEKCSGTGVIQGRPTLYETDTTEEREDAWRMAQIPCDCKQQLLPKGVQLTEGGLKQGYAFGGDRFGVTLTPDGKLYVGCDASDIEYERDSESSKESAIITIPADELGEFQTWLNDSLGKRVAALTGKPKKPPLPPLPEGLKPPFTIRRIASREVHMFALLDRNGFSHGTLIGEQFSEFALAALNAAAGKRHP